MKFQIASDTIDIGEVSRNPTPTTEFSLTQNT